MKRDAKDEDGQYHESFKIRVVKEVEHGLISKEGHLENMALVEKLQYYLGVENMGERNIHLWLESINKDIHKKR